MRTDEKLKELSERLHVNCGDLHEAARFCGVSPAFVMSWMKDDDVAAEALNEAKRVGYLGIESELIRRAVNGVEESVWYKGEEVGYKTVYSDGLLSKLAEARLPDFSKKEQAPGTNFYGNTQINIMPRAANYEEWMAMKDATLSRDSGPPALPAPEVPEILQGTYVEVEAEKPLKALADLI